MSFGLDIETRPETRESDTSDGDDYAHYARKDEILRANLEGGRITAICGWQFEPIRDPSRFPVCPKCKELVGMAEQLG